MKKYNKRRFFFWLTIFASVIALVFFAVNELDARAGSGGNYRSSRSSGSSGGGGAEGAIIELLFRIFLWLLRLCFECPLLGIPLMGLFIFALYMLYKYTKNTAEETTIAYAAKKSANSVRPNKGAINALKQNDPDFDISAFSERVKKAFRNIQKAWSSRDLTSVEAFLSDGSYEQFSVQIDDYKRNHQIDYMDSLDVHNIELLNYSHSGNFEALDVKINAAAINFIKDDRTNEYIEGSKAKEEFSEVWTFVRKRGAKTRNKPGLLESQCPNCGNPVQVGRLTKCNVCGSMLRSGEYDWVLTKITQTAEWCVSSPAYDIVGYELYRSIDPEFTVQHIEDIATVMFWRKTIAERTNDYSYLRKVATNEYTDKEYADAKLSRKFTIRTGLASVRLIGIGRTGNEDTAIVEMLWGGFHMVQRSGEKEPKPLGGYSNKKQHYILIRKAGAATNNLNALNSAHCPNCGAPEDGSENECQYCGTVLNSGEKEWVLSSVEPPVSSTVNRLKTIFKQQKPEDLKNTGASYENIANESVEEYENNKQSQYNNSGFGSKVELPKPEPPKLTPEAEIITNKQMASKVSGKEMIRWAIAMMLADGVIEDAEMKFLRTLGKKYNMERNLQPLINEIQNQLDPIAYVRDTTSVSSPKELLVALLVMAMADGRVTKEENEMLKNFAYQNGFTPSEFKEMAENVKKQLFKDALGTIFRRN